MKSRLGLLLVLCLLSWSSFAQKDFQKKLLTQFIMAEDGATIEIPAGTYTFTGALSLESKKNVTIKGKGMDKTILSFKGQTDGAEGIRVSNCENVVIEGLAVQDAKGDCIKAMNVKGITFRNAKVEWTGTPKKENGSYGFYPVMCDGVVIEGCTAIGSSDAGVYVGQSKNIVVRNNKAYHNVVGFEIENSINSEAYGNEAWDNAAGFFVLDLPKLVQKKGGNTRIHDNYIHDNNYANFAPEGNIVDKVPSGTGFMILGSSHVEVYANRIINNRSMTCGIISYLGTGNQVTDPEFDPFPKAIYIHDNVFERKAVEPTYEGLMGAMFKYKLNFGKDVPTVLFDGIMNPQLMDTNGNYKGEHRICFRNNKGVTFANLDIARDFKNISRDMTAFDCEGTAQKATK
jgi:parallel beta-helix repeat protein